VRRHHAYLFTLLAVLASTVGVQAAYHLAKSPTVPIAERTSPAYAIDAGETSSTEQTVVTFVAGVDTDGNKAGSETLAKDGMVKDGVTVYLSGTGGTFSAKSNYRIYKTSTLTISSSQTIEKIEFVNGDWKDYDDPGPCNFKLDSSSSGSYTPNMGEGTWEGSATAVSFTTPSAKVYITKITVYLAGSATPVTPELTGEGTLESPYTTSDVAALTEAGTAKSNVWVKGIIVGAFADDDRGTLYTDGSVATNIVLAGDDSDEAIANTDLLTAVQLASGTSLQAVANLQDNGGNMGKCVAVCGDIAPYIASGPGVQAVTKMSGLTTLAIKTTEGYATHYNGACAYEMPAGVRGGVVTNASTAGTLTVDYRYAEGQTVPKGSSLLLQGEKGSYDVVNVEAAGSVDGDNLLHGADGINCDADGQILMDAADYIFYKLCYSTAGTDLGFYWGAADGAAFANQGTCAFLAVKAEQAAKGFAFSAISTGMRPVVAEQSSTCVHTLSGVRVSGDRLPAGIYVRDGKKYVVR